jgi:hypothetical protein
MLVNYPLECWDIDTIVNTMAPYGRFLVWNRQDSNKARIFVKIRAYDINKIPGSIVVLHNIDSLGHGSSWSYPCVLFNMHMIGAGPGDEDPLPLIEAILTPSLWSLMILIFGMPRMKETILLHLLNLILQTII